MKKRVYIYIRVSTREQAEEGYSISEQTERLKRYCDAMEWQIEEVYTDGGFTGSNLERPALKEMIKNIKKGRADIVLVDKLDRLSRSQFDTLYLIKKVFAENNCAFVSRAEAFDTSTPFGRAMVGILAVFAELERERIRERMQDGLDGRAKEGKYKGGGLIPVGYEYDRATGTLVVNDYEAMQVREAFDLFISNMPISAIARILNLKGYRNKYGEWQAQTLRRIFKNPLYIGKIKHNAHCYDGQHEAIIEKNIFEEAQKVMKERERKNEKYKVGKKYRSSLGGLIWCGHCGAKYHWKHNGKNKDGTYRSYYMCYSHSKADPKMVKDPNCKNKTYRDFKLEKIIFDEIKKLKTESGYIDSIQDSVDTTQKQKQISKRIEQITAQNSKLMDLYSVGGIDFDTIKDKISTLIEEKNDLQEELDDLKEQQRTTSKKEVLTLVKAFEEVEKAGDTYALNRIISTLIDHIIIDGDDIIIHWNF